jgi:hypothetical protein
VTVILVYRSCSREIRLVGIPVDRQKPRQSPSDGHVVRLRQLSNKQSSDHRRERHERKGFGKAARQQGSKLVGPLSHGSMRTRVGVEITLSGILFGSSPIEANRKLFRFEWRSENLTLGQSVVTRFGRQTSPPISPTAGALEHAQEEAAHESPRTTKLYDRTKERLTQDEVERIRL